VVPAVGIEPTRSQAPRNFESADGFSEVFTEMSDIAGQKVICLDGNGGHENRPVFFRQVDGAGDVGI
jgi:hypothetical protein